MPPRLHEETEEFDDSNGLNFDTLFDNEDWLPEDGYEEDDE